VRFQGPIEPFNQCRFKLVIQTEIITNSFLRRTFCTCAFKTSDLRSFSTMFGSRIENIFSNPIATVKPRLSLTASTNAYLLNTSIQVNMYENPSFYEARCLISARPAWNEICNSFWRTSFAEESLFAAGLCNVYAPCVSNQLLATLIGRPTLSRAKTSYPAVENRAHLSRHAPIPCSTISPIRYPRHAEVSSYSDCSFVPPPSSFSSSFYSSFRASPSLYPAICPPLAQDRR
jgi:hypothetical protein